MRLDLPIIVLMDLNFRETMALIESFSPIVGHLHMEVDFLDLGLNVIFRGFEY